MGTPCSTRLAGLGFFGEGFDAGFDPGLNLGSGFLSTSSSRDPSSHSSTFVYFGFFYW